MFSRDMRPYGTGNNFDIYTSPSFDRSVRSGWEKNPRKYTIHIFNGGRRIHIVCYRCVCIDIWLKLPFHVSHFGSVVAVNIKCVFCCWLTPCRPFISMWMLFATNISLCSGAFVEMPINYLRVCVFDFWKKKMIETKIVMLICLMFESCCTADSR